MIYHNHVSIAVCTGMTISMLWPLDLPGFICVFYLLLSNLLAVSHKQKRAFNDFFFSFLSVACQLCSCFSHKQHLGRTTWSGTRSCRQPVRSAPRTDAGRAPGPQRGGGRRPGRCCHLLPAARRFGPARLSRAHGSYRAAVEHPSRTGPRRSASQSPAGGSWAPVRRFGCGYDSSRAMERKGLINLGWGHSANTTR